MLNVSLQTLFVTNMAKKQTKKSNSFSLIMLKYQSGLVQSSEFSIHINQRTVFGLHPWDFGEQFSFFSLSSAVSPRSPPPQSAWMGTPRAGSPAFLASIPNTAHSRSKQRPKACIIEKGGVLQITYLTAMLHLPQDVVSRSGNWYYCGGHSAKHPRWWRGDTGQSRCAGRGMR